MNLIIFNLKGDLTLNSKPDTIEVIKRNVQAKTQTVLLDVKDIGFVDSAGLAMLIQLCKFTMEFGMRLALCSVPEQMDQLLQLTSTGSLFEIFETRAAFYEAWKEDFPAEANLKPLSDFPTVDIEAE